MAITWANILNWESGSLESIAKDLLEANQVLRKAYEDGEDALRAVAKKAIERKTGARSLRGIIEEVMLDVMFDIPRETAPRRLHDRAARPRP